MGVYIKGMEMPQGCFFCICNKHLDPDTDMCLLTRDAFDSTFRVIEHRRDNCPLVHVPPHGRLVDADRLGFAMMDAANADQALAMVDDAHTVIEAEEDE